MIIYKRGDKCLNPACLWDLPLTIRQANPNTGSRLTWLVLMSGKATKLQSKTKWIHQNRFNSIMLTDSMKGNRGMCICLIITLRGSWIRYRLMDLEVIIYTPQGRRNLDMIGMNNLIKLIRSRMLIIRRISNFNSLGSYLLLRICQPWII